MKLMNINFDGTLLNGNENLLSIREIHALEKAKEENTITVLSSRHTLSRLPRKILDSRLYDFCITSNGAAIIDLRTKQKIFNKNIPFWQLSRVFYTISMLPIGLEVSCNGESYIEKDRIKHMSSMSPDYVSYLQKNSIVTDDLLLDIAGDIEKISLFNAQEKDKRYITSALGGEFFPLAIRFREGNGIEINHPSANEKNAMKYLRKYLKLSS